VDIVISALHSEGVELAERLFEEVDEDESQPDTHRPAYDEGEDGNDLVEGGAGGDLLRGGPGNDLLQGIAGEATDTTDRISCGAGTDTVEASQGDRVALDCETIRRHDL